MASAKPNVLVASLSPYPGGVTVMREFILDCLLRRGFEPIVAFYQPYSIAPRLSAPLFTLLRRSPATQSMTLNGIESCAIGAWLPELEFTQYLPTKHWKHVIDVCQYHVAVIGSCLQALPLVSTGTTFLGWVATPWNADRAQRAQELPIHRRVLDRAVVRPIAGRLERAIVRSGRFLALSEHTRRELNAIAGRQAVSGVLPMPIDTSLFRPAPGRVEPGLVGFVGRFDDARKNAGLFLASLAALIRAGTKVRGVLIGARPTHALVQQVQELGLHDHVEFADFLPRDEVASLLRTIDVFAIPSYQEGLCISGLEAMAAGCPVVSTRCGGPEEYVKNGETGYLVDFSAAALAQRVRAIVDNRELRGRLSAGARRAVEHKYSFASARDLFWREFDVTFSEEHRCRQQF